MEQIKQTDVLILCGGLGTRLRSLISDRPKGLAPFHDRTFLDILIEFYISQGFRRFVLCIGHGAGAIMEHFQSSPHSDYIHFSIENSPLGTGGAIKNAEPMITSDHFFVVNGDSFCEFDSTKLLDYHLNTDDAYASMLLTCPDERTDTGNVLYNDETGTVSGFHEKTSLEQPIYTNAGVYVFHKKILSLIPGNEPFSLEKSLFPDIVNKGFFGYPVDSELIDIGTPERYHNALKVFNK